MVARPRFRPVRVVCQFGRPVAERGRVFLFGVSGPRLSSSAQVLGQFSFLASNQLLSSSTEERKFSHFRSSRQVRSSRRLLKFGSQSLFIVSFIH